MTSTLSGLRVTEELEYDNADRVTSREYTLHDAAGTVRNRISTLSSYDSFGRPESVSSCLDSRLTAVTSNTYDNLGRLSQTRTGSFTTSYTYDSNSNLTGVTCHGLSGVATATGSAVLTYGVVDDLGLSYDGNRLVKVSDSAESPVFTGAPDFNDGADRDTELTYDACGRTLSDSNRGIDSVTYNSIGLPEKIHLANGTYIRQIYLADGQLLRRETADRQTMAGGGLIVTPGLPTIPGIVLPGGDRPGVEIKLAIDSTDYVGPMIFDNGTLSRVEIPGGFIAGDSIHAYLHDHQGNVRRVVNAHTGAVEQETHYYPFGMPFGESTAKALRDTNGSAMQPRRYGGKESVSLGAFTFLDFPARPYDAATARFLTPDPLQEKYTPFSPYLYCMANPINLTDPTGMVVKNGGDAKDSADLDAIIAAARKNVYFDRIYQALDNSPKVFSFQLGEIESVSSTGFNNGVFNKTDKTITISPKLLENNSEPKYMSAQLQNVVAEEFYHAYQTIVFECNIVNIEYEAQVFAYIHNINLHIESTTKKEFKTICENIEEYVDVNAFCYKPSFSSYYENMFYDFHKVFRNHPSIHYNLPAYIFPNRLNNLLKE